MATDNLIQPIQSEVRIPDWHIHVAQMIRAAERDHGNVMEVALEGAHAHLRRRFPNGKLEDNQTLAELREHLRACCPAGAPPRTSAELLIASWLQNGRIKEGCLAWQFWAILIAKSGVPWSVLDQARLQPPLVFRMGEPGESLSHAGTPLSCASLPVLADLNGAVASPFVHGHPDALAHCRAPLLVCYLPAALFRGVDPKSHLGRVVWLTWAYRFAYERSPRYVGR